MRLASLCHRSSSHCGITQLVRRLYSSGHQLLNGYHARVRAYFITNHGQSTQLNIGQPSKVNHPNMICIVDPFVIPHSVVGLVIAGLSDLQRPASQISVSQSSALGITGLIWTRYSLAITPKNWSLFSVNLFVALTALYQVSRGIMYQREQASLTETALAKEK
ncbi:mitochondrial pyruvate carrier 2 isoform X1 [Bombus impatiens]|uniref:Mitochondrial pyruvate carrier n=1 Tax=Bombus impatiens TaxID=132113 RepID=A0A6P6FBP9_BOMIM|nr:mitochondrial pyruvate carrier 2 isoform X1 [Bombus impatiens]